MKKWYAFLGLVIGMCFVPVSGKEAKLYFENGYWICDEPSILTLEVEKAEMMKLYHDGKLSCQLNEEDFVFDEGRWYYSFPVERPGFYLILNEEMTIVEKAIYLEEEMVVGASQPYEKQDDTYILNQMGEIYFIASHEQHLFEDNYETIANWDIWQTTLKSEGLKDIEMNGQTYQFYLDQTPPKITIHFSDEVIVDTFGNYYLTYPDTTLKIIREDISDDLFPLEKPWQKEAEGWVLEISFEHGETVLDDLFCDAAKNSGHQPLTIIRDDTLPQTTLPSSSQIYLSQETLYRFDEPYLDWAHSQVQWNGVDVKESCLVDDLGFTFTISQAGRLSVLLRDFSGNILQQDWQIVFDNQEPQVESFIDGQRCLLKVADMNLDQASLDQVVLVHDGKSIPTKRVETGLEASLLEDGCYEWQGVVQDLAGNQQEVQMMVWADVQNPVISVSELLDDVYTQPQRIQWTFADMFLQTWQIDVYRNGTFLESYNGNQSTTFEILLDDQLFDDGQGKYHLVATAKDSIHTITKNLDVVLDMGCAPFDLWINQALAMQVEHIAVIKEVSLEALCLEGVMTWSLYHSNTLLRSEKGMCFKLDPTLEATHLMMICEDAYGHQRKRRLTLTYSQKTDYPLFDGQNPVLDKEWQMKEENLTLFVGQNEKAEVYVDGEKLDLEKEMGALEVPIPDDETHQLLIDIQASDGTSQNYELEVKGRKGGHLYHYILIVGGVLVAINLIRKSYIMYLHTFRKSEDLLEEETIVLDHRTLPTDSQDQD